MAKLGIETLPTMAYGKLKIKCTKSGVAKITVTAIGGGDKVGTGTVMGGMTITKEFAIIAAAYRPGTEVGYNTNYDNSKKIMRKTIYILFAILGMSLFAGCDDDNKDNNTPLAKQLVGEWRLTSWTGQAPQVFDAYIAFDGGSFTIYQKTNP